jgi:hypothetical protein
MMKKRLGIILLGVLCVAAVYAYGIDTGDLRGRLARHVLASILQVVAPLVAAYGCFVATRAYAPGDREQLVWRIGALGALAWAIGRLIFAFYQWWGETALPYPSIADAFFVAFYVLLAVALALEVRLVNPMLDRQSRVLLIGLGVAAWAAGFVYVLEPIVFGPATGAQKLLAAFYPTAAVFLIPAGLMPAFGFRGGTSAYPWLAVAIAAVCLAVASLGYASLTWYNLYSDVHGINALWLVGFLLLGVGGFWQRMVQEEV